MSKQMDGKSFGNFVIDTPQERLPYFVLETKGSLSKSDLCDSEAVKVKRGEGHFKALAGVGYAIASDCSSAKLAITRSF